MKAEKIKITKDILRLFVFVITLVFSQQIFAQKFGLGLSVIYNFQTESMGTSLRGEFVKNQISIVPQLAYFPAFNKVSEFYAGASLHLNVVSYGDITMYGILHGSYNGWLNYTNSEMEKAKFSNWDGEIGLGIKKGKCLRPFMELRYNFKWKEANLRLGIMYFFNCSKKGHKKKKPASCPAYSN